MTSDTRLVLVNAIYFKGKWDKQFKDAATRDVQFHVTKVTVSAHSWDGEPQSHTHFCLVL